jgi:hypothetical protein
LGEDRRGTDLMRKTENVTVPQDWGGRDAGKVFQVTEAPATQAEKWAWKSIIALKGTSAQIPESLAPLGMVAVAIRGINSFIASDVPFERIEPLLDELMTCVKIVRDPGARDRMTGLPVATDLVSADDIEEVRTVAWLRSEVLRIHTNFSFLDAVSAWVAFQKTAPIPSDTSMSPPVSEPSSPPTQDSQDR